MLARHTPLKRHKPLARGAPLERRTRLAKVSPRRKGELREYHEKAAAYLAAHPFCQIYIAMHGLLESEVIAQAGAVYVAAYGAVRQVPVATEIHHRNKRDGARLTDERWFLAASRPRHELVEGFKTWARKTGFLLELEADPDGVTPDGRRAEETPDFMLRMAREGGSRP